MLTTFSITLRYTKSAIKSFLYIQVEAEAIKKTEITNKPCKTCMKTFLFLCFFIHYCYCICSFVFRAFKIFLTQLSNVYGIKYKTLNVSGMFVCRKKIWPVFFNRIAGFVAHWSLNSFDIYEEVYS